MRRNYSIQIVSENDNKKNLILSQICTFYSTE